MKGGQTHEVLNRGAHGADVSFQNILFYFFILSLYLQGFVLTSYCLFI